jgi:hypothetical protein
MPSEDATVHVIDDDHAARESLAFLLKTAKLAVKTYDSATAFLKLAAEMKSGCIITMFACRRSTGSSCCDGSRSSCISPSSFDNRSFAMSVRPVTLPPGRLRLATRPYWTGSPPEAKTIGIVEVAVLAARAAGVLPSAAITATRRRTRSAANSGSRSGSLCAQRYSMAKLRPSMKPVSLNPLRNAANRFAAGSGEPRYRYPITGVCCCARAASGHAAAPPRSVMN